METATVDAGVLWLLVGIALLYGFLNGYSDAAGAIGPLVSTGVMRPTQAVLWVASFVVLAQATFGLAVAETVARGLVDPGAVDLAVVLGALLAALLWNLGTGWFGLPSSASHALIGGLAGAAVAHSGVSALVGPGVLAAAAAVALAPLAAAAAGIVLLLAVSWAFARTSPRRVERGFGRMQLLSSAARALGHGAADAQKTVGMLWLLLAAGGAATWDRMPGWVVPAAHLALGLGTLYGGWRMIRMMSLRLTPLRPPAGFSAEAGTAAVLAAAAVAGIPVSASQTTTGGVVGVTSVRKFSAARWGLAGRLVWTWVFTMPAAAAIAAALYVAARRVL
jgi:PiT family inorganic phosphate transporter